MGGAGRLAGGCAGVVAVDAVLVAVVDGPLLRPPLSGVGQFLPRVNDRPALGTQFLAQLHRTGGAVLHAAPTGHAVFLFHLGYIGRAAHVGCVEQLAGAQRVADVDIAVADGKNLVLAVNVGDLVHKAVVLGLLQDLHYFVVGDIVALVGLHQIIRHVAHADAPVVRVVAAALAHGRAGHPAGTGPRRILALVLFQPVGDMLNVQRLVLGLDGFFHGDNVHADACTARRHHGGDMLQRQKSHPLKERRHFRVFGDLLLIHVKKLSAAGHKHRQYVLFLPARVLPVILQQAHAGHFVQKRFQFFGSFAGGLYDLRQGHRLAHLHF